MHQTRTSVITRLRSMVSSDGQVLREGEVDCSGVLGIQQGKTMESRCLVGAQKKCEERKARCERIQGQV